MGRGRNRRQKKPSQSKTTIAPKEGEAVPRVDDNPSKSGPSNSDSYSVEERKIRLEEERFDHQRKIETQQLENQRAIGKWKLLSSPAIVAIVAGLIGWLSTLYTSYSASQTEEQKHNQTMQLQKEEQQQRLEIQNREQQGQLILEAIKTEGDGEDRQKQIAANLYFLAKHGLIDLDAKSVEELKSLSGSLLPQLPSRQSNSSPVTGASFPGLGGSITYGESGYSETAGCLVIKDNKPCILTSGLGIPRESINLGASAKSAITNAWIGTILDYIPLEERNTAAGMVIWTDTKVAGSWELSYQIDPTPMEAKVGQSVMKQGATTGLTMGTVRTVALQSVSLDTIDGKREFNGMIVISENFSAPGDSGALVVDFETKRPIGMIIAGNHRETYVVPIQPIMEQLGIDRIVGGTLQD